MSIVQALATNFGATHFGKAPLGDVRRLRRLVMTVAPSVGRTFRRLRSKRWD